MVKITRASEDSASRLYLACPRGFQINGETKVERERETETEKEFENETEETNGNKEMETMTTEGDIYMQYTYKPRLRQRMILRQGGEI